MNERCFLDQREAEARERLERNVTELARNHPLVAVGTAAAAAAVAGSLAGRSGSVLGPVLKLLLS